MHALERLREAGLTHIPRSHSPYWNDRTARRRMARNTRLTRERLARHDDLLTLAAGIAAYVALTGQPFPGLERSEPKIRPQDIL